MPTCSAAGGDVTANVKTAKTEKATNAHVRRANFKGKNIESAQANHSRYIPQKIRIEVRQRDFERCSYVDSVTGRRCECTRGLQYDHIKPFALGGASDSSSNLRLLCAAHNRLAAENIFGVEFISNKIQHATRDLGQ